VERRRRGPFRIFLSQFSDFMVIVLLVAAALAGAIGETLDAVAILVIVVLNAAFGFLHEHRAAQSIALLRALAAPQARVRRSGAAARCPPRLVRATCPARAGNVVPADLRLTQVASLRGQSVLTGNRTRWTSTPLPR
jgi:Ca2+-transporting ATPase